MVYKTIDHQFSTESYKFLSANGWTSITTLLALLRIYKYLMISTNASLIKDVHWRGNRCLLIVSKRNNTAVVTAVRVTSHLSGRLTA